MVTTFIQHTSQVAAMLAFMAARHAGWRIAYLLQNVPQRDPWRPLLELWRHGAWPMGSLKDGFLVYLPAPQN